MSDFKEIKKKSMIHFWAPKGFLEKKGDLLVFDANIIHRGLYGGERFAFDILFCQPLSENLKFVNKEVYPKAEELEFMDCPEIFNF